MSAPKWDGLILAWNGALGYIQTGRRIFETNISTIPGPTINFTHPCYPNVFSRYFSYLRASHLYQKKGLMKILKSVFFSDLS